LLRQYAFYRYVPEAAESIQIPAANLTIILRRDTRPEKKKPLPKNSGSGLRVDNLAKSFLADPPFPVNDKNAGSVNGEALPGP